MRAFGLFLALFLQLGPVLAEDARYGFCSDLKGRIENGDISTDDPDTVEQACKAWEMARQANLEGDMETVELCILVTHELEDGYVTTFPLSGPKEIKDRCGLVVQSPKARGYH